MRREEPAAARQEARDIAGAALALGIVACSLNGGSAAAEGSLPRAFEFTANEFTQPSIEVSSDGALLVVAALGDLFTIDRTTGDAEARTTGAAFDWAPRLSPGGQTLAYGSDGPDGMPELYLLDLSGGRPQRLTKGVEIEGPATWTADGQSLIVERDSYYDSGARRRELWRIHRDGVSERLSPAGQSWRAPFAFEDGRLGAVADFTIEGRLLSAVCVFGEGVIDTLAVIDGQVLRPRLSPDEAGLAFRLREHDRETLVWMTLAPPTLRPLLELERPDTPEETPTFGMSPDGTLIIGDHGQIAEVDPSDGRRTPLPLFLRFQLEVDPAASPIVRRIELPWERAGASIRLLGIESASFDATGRMLLVGAAGDLFLSRDRGRFERLTSTPSLELEPRLSPGGGECLFTAFRDGRATVFRRSLRRVAPQPVAGDLAAFAPEWAPDGRSIWVAAWEDYRTSLRRIAARGAGAPELLVLLRDPWHPAPSARLRHREVYVNVRSRRRSEWWVVDGSQVHPVPLGSDIMERIRVAPSADLVAYRHRGRIAVARFANGDLGPHLDLGAGNDARFSAGHLLSALTRDTLLVWNTRQLERALVDSSSPGPPPEIRRLEIDLARPQPPPPLLIEHVRLWDGTGAPTRAERSIFIEGGRIRRIDDTAADWPERQRADVERLDAVGAYAVPGLIDLHVHLGATPPEALLAHGVTAVRDLGADAAFVRGIREAVESGTVTGPHVFFSGEIFEGPEAVWGDNFLIVDTEQEIPERVARLVGYGASFLKTYPTLARTLERSVLRHARAHGLGTATHVGSLPDLVSAIHDGFETLEHTLLSPTYGDVHALIAAAGVGWVPTLTIRGIADRVIRDEPERLSDRRLVATVPAVRLAQAVRGATPTGPIPAPELDASIARQLQVIRDAHARGCRLLVGTDAGHPGVFHGPSLAWELKALVEADLSAEEALTAATRQAARILHASHDLGTVEVGKVADLVLLQEDPLIDIGHVENILRVISQGRLLEVYELVATLEDRRID